MLNSGLGLFCSSALSIMEALQRVRRSQRLLEPQLEAIVLVDGSTLGSSLDDPELSVDDVK